MFLMKFAEDGQWQWTQQRGTPRFDAAWALEIDDFDRSVVAGYSGGALDGNQHAGSASAVCICVHLLCNTYFQTHLECICHFVGRGRIQKRSDPQFDILWFKPQRIFANLAKAYHSPQLSFVII